MVWYGFMLNMKRVMAALRQHDTPTSAGVWLHTCLQWVCVSVCAA